MNSSSIAVIMMMIVLVIIVSQRNNIARIIAGQKTNKISEEEKQQMVELAKSFIGRECIIYTINSQLEGTILQVEQGALLVQSKNSRELINLDFVTRIREYPRNKNGKKKGLVID